MSLWKGTRYNSLKFHRKCYAYLYYSMQEISHSSYIHRCIEIDQCIELHQPGLSWLFSQRDIPSSGRWPVPMWVVQNDWWKAPVSWAFIHPRVLVWVRDWSGKVSPWGTMGETLQGKARPAIRRDTPRTFHEYLPCCFRKSRLFCQYTLPNSTSTSHETSINFSIFKNIPRRIL